MLEELLLFPMRGVEVDNDRAFLKAPLEQRCEKHQPRIELNRSRAYRSKEQAWVEQKKGMLVGHVVTTSSWRACWPPSCGGALRGPTAIHQPQIEQWLVSEACRKAAEMLRRLMALAPGCYHEGQLRSIERRVKERRTAGVERLLGTMRSARKGTQIEEMTNAGATAIGGNTL